MRKYNGVVRGLWGRWSCSAIALALAAGCATAPKTYQYTEPPDSPPPAQGQWSGDTAPVEVKDNAPLTYVVKKGDTLWDIAGHFLSEPWQWPEIWVVNSQVKNPHLIYPGDVLQLTWTNGRPSVTLTGENKLSPRIRELSLADAIPTIPLEAIRDFLMSPRVVDNDVLERAPYILEFVDPHLLGGADHEVYVKNVPREGIVRYETVRRGQRYVDPDTHEVLGWEAIPVGDIEIRDFGVAQEPSVAVMTRAEREVRVGDRLLKPEGDVFNANFHPRAPTRPVEGRILAVFDGVSQIGQYAVITLNKGVADGLEPGHVLSILQAGRTAQDPYEHRQVALPRTFAGLAMVFKVDARTSYALVMKLTREVHVLDYVTKPTTEQF